MNRVREDPQQTAGSRGELSDLEAGTRYRHNRYTVSHGSYSSMSPVVAVVGTIAGAGATTTVSALGTALAEQRRRVALVDATAEGSRIAEVLDVEGGGELADALRRGTAVPDVQGSGPHDVAAFPAAPDTSWGSMRPDAVATLYDQLRERFEFVLVDCGSDLSPARSAWLGHADEVLIVTDPDVAGAVPETASLAGAFDVPVRGVLANRVRPKEVGDAVDALDGTDLTVLGVLPEDPTVGLAAGAGDSVLRTEPDSTIANVAWELALRYRRREHDDPVVPFGTGPPPSAEPDDSTADADDPTSEDGEPTADDAEPTPAASDPTAVNGAPDADRTDDGAGDSTSTTSTEPASLADDASAPPEEEVETGSVEPESADPAEPTTSSGTGESEPGTSDDGPGDGGSQEPETVSTDDDPFTSPDPLAVEDDEAEAADAEGGASGSEPSGSLLGDVRARIGEQHPDEPAAGSEPEDSAADAPDPAGDPAEPDPAPSETDDGFESAAASGGSSGEESDLEPPEDEADEESAALSDEEIESLFAETMERVQERRESESGESEDEESADGTSGADEAD